MSNKSSLAERLIIFSAFLVFAGLIVSLALIKMPKQMDDEIETPDLQYKTVSKSDFVGSDLQSSSGVSNLVNINTDSAEKLMTLPGIGDKKAQAIIDYRNETGPFNKKEDIKNVSGIGDATFEKLKDLITVE